MFNPITASDNIKQSYVDYISTTLSIADRTYQEKFREALSQDEGISKGPYLDIGGAFKSGQSLKELVEIGKASELFGQLESVPEKDKELKYERALYSHQEEAFVRARDGANLVVTTGTGSGKTECFLTPILHSLLEEIQNKTLTDGVRAIIIYPMNALANDQMDRMRRILKTQPEITFGLYNSSTEYKQDKAVSSFREFHKNSPISKEPLPNEVISREVMQSKPPHILVTNYSMLEHMMLRPKDDAVFSGADLRYIVLDEAHIYRGATGIEMSLLMRRLKARVSSLSKVQYILTSATLGDRDSDDQIVDFAKNLCGEDFRTENIIRSTKITQPLIAKKDFPLELFKEIYEEVDPIGEILKKHGADFAPEGDDNEKIYELLLRSRVFGKLRQVVNKPKTVSEIASELAISRESLVHFIATCAMAVKNGESLVKPRYHFFLRALEGAYISLGSDPHFYLTRKEKDENKKMVFECAVCNDCDRHALAGQISNKHLVQAKQGFSKNTDFFLVKEVDEKEFDLGDEESLDESVIRGTDENDYVLCSVCGAIGLERVIERKQLCKHDSQKYIKLRKAKETKKGESKCPACEFGNFRRFYLGYEAATGVLGTALYEELPEYERVRVSVLDEKNDNGGFFGLSKPKSKKTIPKQRQFLAFSDSRADAAFFASYMDKSYEEFLRRRGLWQVCDQKLESGRSELTVRETASALARLFEKNDTFVEIGKANESQTDNCKIHAYVAIMNELVSSRRSSGLVQLGKLAFYYSPKDVDKKNRWEKAVEVTTKTLANQGYATRDAKALLNLIILDAVYSGAVEEGDEITLNGEEREYLFYSTFPKKLVKVKTVENKKNHLSGWLPRQRTGKTKSYFYSTRIQRVISALGFSEKKAWDFLENIWDEILFFGSGADYALSILDFNIALYDSNSKKLGNDFSSYRCNKCGKVTAFNCQDRCSNVKCTGELEEFDPIEVNEFNHYVKLYKSKNLKPFYIKEHTAQLSRKRAAKYQEMFVNKQINALSSSTTFEMGVDVGSLETVFLRNIPPTPANYVQRAGRAGRSLQSAAYAITYAKLSSHDLTYFAQPEDMISGKIKAPVFSLENEKIIRRHINAVALAAFFKEYEEIYDDNNRSEFLNSGGYGKFKEYLASKPEKLKGLLEKSIPSGNYGVDDWSWTESLVGENGILELTVNDFNETVKSLEEERERLRSEGDDYGAAGVSRKLKNFRADKNFDKDKNGKVPRRQLIGFLVRNNVLPKYGFPVDTVELLPSTDFGDENRPQMQRDLQLAVAEYAPGSEIVADGMIYTSRYINRSTSSAHNWEYGWFARCPNQSCRVDNYYSDSVVSGDVTCRSCGEKIGRYGRHKTLEPRRGFVAGNSDLDRPREVKMQKPERNYRADDFYIGDPSRQIIDKYDFSVGNQDVSLESTSNDSLVVRTQTKFEVCNMCGYATGKNEKYQKNHKNAFGGKCLNDDAGFEYFLTHEFKTDVARVTFKDERALDYDCMLSVLYGLLEAMAKELDIERNDIKGCLYRAKLKNGSLINNIIIYDAVAGGAGHSRRLVTADGKQLSRVIKRAVRMLDNCDCEPSCYKCLRSYYNQRIHDRLDRRKAADFLRKYVGEIQPAAFIQESENESLIVKIKDSTKLKEDYLSWKETYILFEGYEGLIATLDEQEVPLADSFGVEMEVGSSNINAILLWEDEQCIICESLTQKEKDSLTQTGWKYLTLDDQNTEKTYECFGDANNG